MAGRIVLNLWRIMRKEAASLLSYTFENVVYRLLHERVSLYAFSTLTRFYESALERLDFLLLAVFDITFWLWKKAK